MRPGAQPGLYAAGAKRVFDLLMAAICLPLLLPVFLLVAIACKLFAPGPVFFLQERMGKSGRIFRIVKFRTMYVDADHRGPNITAAGDPRVTPFGRIMRTLKLDELPQLWNVLKGDMSLVGPRPELPAYLENYSQEQRKVFTVRPGITDPASIAYRHEEKLLAKQEVPGTYYREVVLPHKLALSLEYIGRMSLRNDLSILGKTLWSLRRVRNHAQTLP